MDTGKQFILSLTLLALCGACRPQSGIKEAADAGMRNIDSVFGTGFSAPAPVVHEVQPDRDLTDVARFIAGMAPSEGGRLDSLCRTDAWKRYAAHADSAWTRHRREQADSIRRWARAELPEGTDTIGTVFYPFSGPDYFNVNLYYPNARHYILFGMEAPGGVPDPRTDAARVGLAQYLGAYGQEISGILRLSFFQTKLMATRYETQEMYGVTPLLLLFLARADKEIVRVRPFAFIDGGERRYLDHTPRYRGEEKFGKGVEIEFTDPDHRTLRTLTYFAANIADGGLSINTPTRDFLATIDSGCAAYVKSATYLMHKAYFSTIRNTVLSKAAVILQDDSGIKYSFFDPARWEIRLYGTYNKPIALFGNHFEEDLYAAYRRGDARPLPFRRGYNSQSNQLLARRLRPGEKPSRPVAPNPQPAEKKEKTP